MNLVDMLSVITVLGGTVAAFGGAASAKPGWLVVVALGALGFALSCGLVQISARLAYACLRQNPRGRLSASACAVGSVAIPVVALLAVIGLGPLSEWLARWAR